MGHALCAIDAKICCHRSWVHLLALHLFIILSILNHVTILSLVDYRYVHLAYILRLFGKFCEFHRTEIFHGRFGLGLRDHLNFTVFQMIAWNLLGSFTLPWSKICPCFSVILMYPAYFEICHDSYKSSPQRYQTIHAQIGQSNVSETLLCALSFFYCIMALFWVFCDTSFHPRNFLL